ACRMKGAVAAGHPLTAEAGARILAEGGNAVDACIASAFTSWVVESPLTGPGAGGFMLVHRARDGTTRLLDFFVATPGLGRAYGKGGARLAAGDRVVLPDLAETLEILAGEGADALYRGDLGRALVRHLEETGGSVTAEDLARYRVVRRRPVRAAFLGHEFVSNPPPSSGGVLIGYGLRLLDLAGPAGPAGSAEAIALLVEV